MQLIAEGDRIKYGNWNSVERQFKFYKEKHDWGKIFAKWVIEEKQKPQMNEILAHILGDGLSLGEKAIYAAYIKELFKDQIDWISGKTKKELSKIGSALKVAYEFWKSQHSTEEEPKKINERSVIPILEGAILEDSEEDKNIYNKWISLLVEGMEKGYVHPNYISILNRISPNDAKVLDTLFKWRIKNPDGDIVLAGIGVKEALKSENIFLTELEIQESIEDLISIGLCQKNNFQSGIVRAFSLKTDGVDFTATGFRFMKTVTKSEIG